MRIAIATIAERPQQFDDDELLASRLADRGAAVEHVPWRDADADWTAFDAVVIRSTWDYAFRRDEFVAWAEGVGERLHNSSAIVRWNSDKRYLGELGEAGFPVVPTEFLEPGAELPALSGEVVVKPAVSGGARDTGRFSPEAHDQAVALIKSIHDKGKTAMIQPYVDSVDSRGETAVVCLDGEPAYALRKGAVLRPDEVAPVRDDVLAAAEAMYDPDLVMRGTASGAELELARAILVHVAERFDYLPLYARVDLIADGAGNPSLIELEAIEPNLYLNEVQGSASRVADAVIGRLRET